MLKIHILPLGDYMTNCYILHNEGAAECCVIDPGYDADEILTYLGRKGLSLKAIALTHCHFDHVGAVRDLAAETGCPVYVHEAELSMPPMVTGGKIYYTDTYAEGDVITPAGLNMAVLHTPGHTPGSVCLKVEDALFSGDTLFAMSCGRTDLPGGSWKTIQTSLKRLAALEEDLQVFPGHGESTTLSQEKRYNPYMR